MITQQNLIPGAKITSTEKTILTIDKLTDVKKNNDKPLIKPNNLTAPPVYDENTNQQIM